MRCRDHILIAHFSANVIAGAELAITDMAAACAEDFRLQMWVPGSGALSAFYRNRGVPVWQRNVQTPRRKFPGLHTIQSLLAARVLRQRRVGAVICNTLPAYGRVGTACRFSKTPCAVYLRDHPVDAPLNRRLVASADVLFAVSQTIRDWMQQLANGRQIEVLYDTIDLAQIDARISVHRARGKRVLQMPPGSCAVGVIGRVQDIKNQALLLRAMPRVFKAVPEARVFIVGGCHRVSDQPYRDALAALAQELGIMEKVTFLGHRTDSIEIMSELSVCCVPSSQEAFPRVILEAQAVGVPLVASDIAACKEQIVHGRTGLLFELARRDAEEKLAMAVVQILRNESLQRRVVRSARENVESRFGSGEPVRAFCRAVRGMLQHKQNSRTTSSACSKPAACL